MAVTHRIALTIFCLIGCAAASAQVVYTYQGAPFTIGSDTNIYANGQAALLDFVITTPTITDAVSGSITLPDALAPNLSDTPVLPLNVMFTVVGIPVGPLVSDSFDFSTNAAGMITGYSYSLEAIYGGTALQTVQGSSTGGDKFVTTSAITFGQSIVQTITSAYNGVAGTWSGPVSAPEIDPQGAIGALSLLAGLLAVVRGRRRLRGV